ncbi:MAG: 50S ribosomal protein L22 [Clostridia bacterium]|jgi:large subunit ribosomal protein L22|nr:50S ribosomal protein L22 [Clostridia bacterium]
MEANKTAKAYLRYARISPRKVCIVLDLIRGKKVDTAMAILNNTPKSASEYLIKLLKSAVANAEHNFNMDPEKLYVTECFVCPGPTLKRIRPRAQGRANRILKRTSHVTIAVAEKN